MKYILCLLLILQCCTANAQVDTTSFFGVPFGVTRTEVHRLMKEKGHADFYDGVWMVYYNDLVCLGHRAEEITFYVPSDTFITCNAMFFQADTVERQKVFEDCKRQLVKTFGMPKEYRPDEGGVQLNWDMKDKNGKNVYVMLGAHRHKYDDRCFVSLNVTSLYAKKK